MLPSLICCILNCKITTILLNRLGTYIILNKKGHNTIPSLLMLLFRFGFFSIILEMFLFRYGFIHDERLPENGRTERELRNVEKEMSRAAKWVAKWASKWAAKWATKWPARVGR